MELVCVGVVVGGGLIALIAIVVGLGKGNRANLINCKSCGGGVSPYAQTCPHCGQPVK